MSSKRIGTIAAGIIAASVVLASSEGAKALECPTPHPNHSDLALPQTQTEIRSYSKLIAAQGGASNTYHPLWAEEPLSSRDRRCADKLHDRLVLSINQKQCGVVGGAKEARPEGDRKENLRPDSRVKLLLWYPTDERWRMRSSACY